MPRPTKGPRLGGSAQHERHLLANLATQLIVHESIKTTEARARRLRPTGSLLHSPPGPGAAAAVGTCAPSCCEPAGSSSTNPAPVL